MLSDQVQELSKLCEAQKIELEGPEEEGHVPQGTLTEEEERAVEEVAHVEDGGGGGSAHQRRDVRVSVGGGIGFRTIA